MLSIIKKIIPKQIFRFLQPVYHYNLSLVSAIIHGFPAQGMYVIGVTGTKGKSSTTEIINSILENAGYKTALTNTIRFKIGNDSIKNLYKMSMPGRFFMQSFLAKAKRAGCTHAVIEMTSEGAKQFRHKWIDLDAFVFTNLSPEHIESHGSYENYKKAKLSIGKLAETSKKPKKFIVVNADDENASMFLNLNVENKLTYSLTQAEPYSTEENNTFFTFDGMQIRPKLIGKFNIYNCLAAATLAKQMGISNEVIAEGIQNVTIIEGRVQKVDLGQGFDVVVDYAHTIDSLEKLYQAFPNQRKICVLGNTGGGRDTWKRPGMAKVADEYCDRIILTNEDPYDENPEKIVEEMRVAVTNKPCDVIMDRRDAIAKAISYARLGNVVLITGKGTDPYIMEANGRKVPWSDAEVAKEEIQKMLDKRTP
ncbi:MAG TPA: UDP-N-acetylmuramoyl-L-alanyl-D-glutamate--2,6-diaminopimelate ligase [Candidatus Nanoarchaeia archaeon]|nr:UDP-N-acetylmuramoyl-L-alanyl-D-glutamate--2,6-diaminopimelate ligase [Candidatus Nanoarchaeia archaeon]